MTKYEIHEKGKVVLVEETEYTKKNSVDFNRIYRGWL